MSGPEWASTLLIWTCDEHGGYYDHVPPPKAIRPGDIPPEVPKGQVYDRFGRYGFRVPCAVVSPWGLCSILGPGTIPPPGSVT